MTNPSTPKDQIFARQMQPSDFIFDDNVAGVFEDMINRSVPGYATIVNMIGILAQRYSQPHTKLFDLGCSLGGASFAMASQLDKSDCSIEAIDNSEAMIIRLNDKLTEDPEKSALINCHCADIQTFPIENASIVVLNFTLQFIPMVDRIPLLKRIFDGMKPGALLVVQSKQLITPKQ